MIIIIMSLILFLILSIVLSLCLHHLSHHHHHLNHHHLSNYHLMGIITYDVIEIGMVEEWLVSSIIHFTSTNAQISPKILKIYLLIFFYPKLHQYYLGWYTDHLQLQTSLTFYQTVFQIQLALMPKKSLSWVTPISICLIRKIRIY